MDDISPWGELFKQTHPRQDLSSMCTEHGNPNRMPALSPRGDIFPQLWRGCTDPRGYKWSFNFACYSGYPFFDKLARFSMKYAQILRCSFMRWVGRGTKKTTTKNTHTPKNKLHQDCCSMRMAIHDHLDNLMKINKKRHHLLLLSNSSLPIVVDVMYSILYHETYSSRQWGLSVHVGNYNWAEDVQNWLLCPNKHKRVFHHCQTEDGSAVRAGQRSWAKTRLKKGFQSWEQFSDARSLPTSLQPMAGRPVSSH